MSVFHFLVAYCSLAQNIFMRKMSVVAVMILLIIASCTKKAAPTVTKEPAIDGGPIFAQNCAGCHGATGKEGRAPNLAEGGHSASDVAGMVANGSGRMPAFANRLSAKEIDAVALFVVHLSK
jgi:mono/diheme cytochrome c family protein